MKIFMLFLIIMLAMLGPAMGWRKGPSDEVKACKKGCYKNGYEPVCSTTRGTYYNKCELDCVGAELRHTGECNYDDLLYSRIEE